MSSVQRTSENSFPIPLYRQPVNAAPPMTNNESLLRGRSGDVRLTPAFPMLLSKCLDQVEIKNEKNSDPVDAFTERLDTNCCQYFRVSECKISPDAKPPFSMLPQFVTIWTQESRMNKTREISPLPRAKKLQKFRHRITASNRQSLCSTRRIRHCSS